MRGPLAALCALFVSCAAQAQGYPAKPVRFVVPFAPGGITDIIARVVGQKLGESWGQSVLVENRAGAGSNIGVALVAKSAPDGYTVLLTTSSIAVNVTLTPDSGYDAEKDFIPVANVASSPNMIVTAQSGPASLRELVAQAKAKPLAYGSAGTGTTPHLSAEYLFRVLAKLEVTHIPYKGAAPAVNAALSGEVGAASVAMPTAVPHIKGGRLRGLAVTSNRRIAALPEVPTVAESGFPGFEDYTWVGVFVPAGTPAASVAKINTDIERLLAQPEFRERLAALGFEPVGGTPESFARYLKTEIAKWAKVVRETGAKVE
jgi:tripartite-type tricarboxylate transporter receptor subunit TctC